MSTGGDVGTGRRWAREVAVGATLGTLAGLLMADLGVWALGRLPIAGSTALMCGVGIGLALARMDRWLLGADVLLLAVCGIVAFTPAIQAPEHHWIRDDPIPSAPVDAVVVLSGGVTVDSTVNAEAADRLLAGLELIRRGVAHRLVTTRVTATDGSRFVTSDADQRRLIALTGLDPEWTVVGGVHSTHDEALRAATFLVPRGATAIVVVTSPLHTRRACATFEAQGFRVVCVAAAMRTAASRNPSTPLTRLAVFRDYLYERLGMRYYQARHWVR